MLAGLDALEHAYAMLPDATRLTLLRSYLPGLVAAPERFAEFDAPPGARDQTEAAIETIFALGHEDAGTLVRMALSDHGLSADELANTAGRHDRAARLWLLDRDHARRLLRWWNGNAIVRSRDRVEMYRCPQTALPDGALAHVERLEALVGEVFLEFFGNRAVPYFKAELRPSPWPNRAASEVLQIDIKQTGDPERVEIEEGGQILSRTLRFVGSIVVIVDPGTGTVYVGSEKKRRGFRAALAQAVLQHLYGEGGEPERLPKLPVHPSRLRTAPEFAWDNMSALVEVRVSELWYRRIARSLVTHSVSADQPGVDIYDSPELVARPEDIVPFKAGVAFTFRRTAEEYTRVVTISAPNAISYRDFLGPDRAVAERVLIDNGLVDADPALGQQSVWALLEPMTEGGFALQLEPVTSPAQLEAIRRIGVLVDTPPSENAYCSYCNTAHTVSSDAGQLVVNCPQGFHTAAGAQGARAMIRFLPGKLARWLAASLNTDGAGASSWHTGLWDLGDVIGGGTRPNLGVILATQLHLPGQMRAIATRIKSMPKRKRGIVITLAARYADTPVPSGWTMATMAGLVSQTVDGLKIDRDDLFRAAGEHLPTAKPARNWKSLFDTYEREVRAPGLTHYKAAEKLKTDHPEICPWTVDTVARKLKDKFKDDFA